jgi:hypothetical protein
MPVTITLLDFVVVHRGADGDEYAPKYRGTYTWTPDLLVIDGYAVTGSRFANTTPRRIEYPRERVTRVVILQAAGTAMADTAETELTEGPDLLARYTLRKTKWGLSLFYAGDLVASTDPDKAASLLSLINVPS